MRINISGLDRSGKSTLCRHLEDKGYQIIELGSIVETIMKLKQVSSEKITDFYNSNKESGLDLRIIKMIQELTIGNKVAYSGCRSISLFHLLKQKCGIDLSIFISSSLETRYIRHKREDKYGRNYSLKEFTINDSIQIGWGITKIQNNSITITNESSLNRLISNFNTIILDYEL
ncbi:hypothetical protein [Roseivirga sp.]|uniref:hypothetical protein n=1 Tax=Roseivirga sp. TaxID=1964215 RepID=UPI002B276C27|nr:hypothetical protein [Roseivirga sp.]